MWNILYLVSMAPKPKYIIIKHDKNWKSIDKPIKEHGKWYVGNYFVWWWGRENENGQVERNIVLVKCIKIHLLMANIKNKCGRDLF